MHRLNHIKVVLVETSHPGNIGSTARAMKTMGLEHLVLVNPKVFPSEEANSLACGAVDILENCQVVASLNEAVGDCQKVYACTARARELDWPMSSPREMAKDALELTRRGAIAIVFGPERTGLSNEALWLCDAGVCIPTSSTFRSLNLAQAVQLIAYELRVHLEEGVTKEPLVEEPRATHAAMERFYAALERLMLDVEFMHQDEPKRLMPKLRRLFNRASITISEMNILRGIITQIEKHLP